MEDNTPFNMIGMDFAGPVKYRDKCKEEQKAYVALYSCSLTRGVTAQYGDYRVRQESEAVNCQKRTTIKDLFRQWSDLCCCSQVAKESTQR